MATAPITATNLANWIPIVFPPLVLADMEKALVTGALVDRRWEAYVREGSNKVVVPHLFNITASVANSALDMTLYDAVQNVTNIDLDQKYDIGVSVDDINQLQSNPKYFNLVKDKCVYGLARQVDINVNALFKSFSQAVGTVNVALTEDELISAYEYLNLADAPATERAWVFDPESITDLMKRDYLVRMDYVPDSIVRSGFQGRQIFGSPVYMTTNLDTYAGGPHASAYLHKEALALVIQGKPKFETFRWGLRHSDVLSGLVLYGVKEMRDSFGVCINCRS